jgi:hypothetical protein
MKTIYSLQEFKNEVKKIAALIEEDYVRARVEVTGEDKITFSCYINSATWTEGDTMESCLEKMKNNINRPATPNIDVEIEMEEILNPQDSANGQ